MTKAPKPDLSEHEEEAAPFDDVLRKLLEAKHSQKQNGLSIDSDAPTSAVTPDQKELAD